MRDKEKSQGSERSTFGVGPPNPSPSFLKMDVRFKPTKFLLNY